MQILDNEMERKGKHKRHDIVMDAKTRIKMERNSNDKRPKIPEIVQEEGFEWLRKKERAVGLKSRKGR